MAVVSVTRLHLASIVSFPRFFYYAIASSQQTRRSPGFITGWLSTDSEWSFWTATVWESSAAMRAYRNSGVHMQAMPKLLRWCDEATFVHWEQADGYAPTSDVAYDRLAREGTLSKVNAPSARQKAGDTVGRGKAGRLTKLTRK
jgi:heme-degrading monooxygenase HmoA